MFSRDGHFGLGWGGGGVGTRPRHLIVCLWRRLLASRRGGGGGDPPPAVVGRSNASLGGGTSTGGRGGRPTQAPDAHRCVRLPPFCASPLRPAAPHLQPVHRRWARVEGGGRGIPLRRWCRCTPMPGTPPRSRLPPVCGRPAHKAAGERRRTARPLPWSPRRGWEGASVPQYLPVVERREACAPSTANEEGGSAVWGRSHAPSPSTGGN